MLEVKTPQEVLSLIQKEFKPLGLAELVPLSDALGRVLAEPVTADEYVPDFDRSTVDGYAWDRVRISVFSATAALTSPPEELSQRERTAR